MNVQNIKGYENLKEVLGPELGQALYDEVDKVSEAHTRINTIKLKNLELEVELELYKQDDRAWNTVCVLETLKDATYYLLNDSDQHGHENWQRAADRAVEITNAIRDQEAKRRGDVFLEDDLGYQGFMAEVQYKEPASFTGRCTKCRQMFVDCKCNMGVG